MEVSSHLKHLFHICDESGSGYLGPEQLRTLCLQLDLGECDIDAVFEKLDQDKDGRISFKDFCHGFFEFISHNSKSPSWNQESLDNLLKQEKVFLSLSERQPSKEEPIINQSLVATHLEGVFHSLLDQVQTLEEEKAQLESALKKERKEHQSYLNSLEEEVDSQVKETELLVKQKAEETIEAERKILQEHLGKKLSELQAQISLVEKVNSWVQFSKKEEERLSNETRQLRIGLLDTQTHVALLRSELEQLRRNYEEKCKVLASERNRVIALLQEQEYFDMQLEILNKFHETSSKSRASEKESPFSSDIMSTGPQRGSFISEYQNVNLKWENQKILRDLESAPVDTHYKLHHFEEDLDSGLSTFRDVSEDVTSEQELEITSMGSEQDCRLNEKECEKRKTHAATKSKMASPPTPPPERKPPPQPSTNGKRHFQNKPIPLDEKSPDRTCKVIFIGDASVGKSTFILRVSKEAFVPSLPSTLGVDFQLKTVHINDKVVALQLWDTAGQERFRSITKSYFRKADAIVLMYDCTSESSFLNVRHWIDAIDDSPAKNVPLILVANKCDLLHATSRRTVPSQEGFKLSKDFGAMFYEVSAKTGYNVMESMVHLTKMIMEYEDLSLKNSNLNLTDKISKKKCCG